MRKIIATLPEKRIDGLKSCHRKEKGFYKQFSAITSDLEDIVTARFYMPGECRIYCCIWFGTGDKYGSGSGFAGGYGYDKASQALQNALDSAGVTLSQYIGGSGLCAETVMALAEALCPGKRICVFQAHP